MFALVITLISIVLVAALALASIYYGGTAFSQGSAKAQASTILSQAQQIGAAVTLYENNNSDTAPASPNNLEPTYLQALPTPPSSVSGGYSVPITVLDNTIQAKITQANVCLALDQLIDPTLSAVPTYSNQPVRFWCHGSASPYAFAYKVG